MGKGRRTGQSSLTGSYTSQLNRGRALVQVLLTTTHRLLLGTRFDQDQLSTVQCPSTVQGITQAKGIPAVRMGKTVSFWCGEKGLVVWKRAVPLDQEVICFI